MTRHNSTPGLTATIAAVALVLTACTDKTGASADDDPASPSTESSPSQPASSPTDWTAVPTETGDFLPAGRLGMTANGRTDAPWAVVEVPEHFSTIDGWVIFDEDPRGGGGVSYWTVSEVVRDPCSDSPHPMDAGSTVEELAATFQRQRLTQMTAPVPVKVDGYRGLSLELRVPPNIDVADCTEYNLWESDPAGARHMGVDGPAEFDRLWMLDVEGEVVVLTVTADLDVPKSALDQLTDMVESVEFIARD